METLKQDIKDRMKRGLTLSEAILETVLDLEFMNAKKSTIKKIIEELTKEIENETKGK